MADEPKITQMSITANCEGIYTTELINYYVPDEVAQYILCQLIGWRDTWQGSFSEWEKVSKAIEEQSKK